MNVFSELSQVWGIRDFVGQTDSHMLRYDASMSLDRRFSDAWASDKFETYFGEGAFPEVRRIYKLLHFPIIKPLAIAKGRSCAGTNYSSENCADLLLNRNENFVKPASIYKPWSFPTQQIRVGFATILSNPTISMEYVADVRYLMSTLSNVPAFEIMSKVPLPGRLAFGLLVSPASTEVPEIKVRTAPFSLEPTGKAVILSGASFDYGVTYERPITNLFGYFGGYFSRRYRLRESATFTPSPLFQPRLELPTLSVYHVGLYVEASKLSNWLPKNLTVHLGPQLLMPGGNARFGVRIGFSVWRRRGRDEFGNPS